jgi:hypothetical protein
MKVASVPFILIILRAILPVLLTKGHSIFHLCGIVIAIVTLSVPSLMSAAQSKTRCMALALVLFSALRAVDLARKHLLQSV